MFKGPRSRQKRSVSFSPRASRPPGRGDRQGDPASARAEEEKSRTPVRKVRGGKTRACGSRIVRIDTWLPAPSCELGRSTRDGGIDWRTTIEQGGHMRRIILPVAILTALSPFARRRLARNRRG